MTFELVYGQNRVKKLLSSSMERDRLAHAYLFHGQPGVGKDAMALAMVLSLNCDEDVQGGCRTCPSCTRILNLEHPNFRLVMPAPTRPKSMKEEKYREIIRERALQRIENPYLGISYGPEITTLPNIGIQQIRQLKQEVTLKIAGNKSRIFLISQADKMTPEASNSLLKLLEEPPERTILFLTTSMPSRLLETIISRCQVMRFDPLSDEDVHKALIDRTHIPVEKAMFLAKLAGGSLKRGLELAEEDFDNRRATALQFLEKSLEDDSLACMAFIETLLNGQDKVEITEILRLVEIWLLDLFCLKTGFPQRVTNTDHMEQLSHFNEKWPGFDTQTAMGHVQQSIDFIEKNVYLNLILHTLCLEFQDCFN